MPFESPTMRLQRTRRERLSCGADVTGAGSVSRDVRWLAPMRILILFAAAVLLVVGCRTATAGEITLPEHHLSVRLPEPWKQIPEQRPGILVRAESDSGRLRFILTRPPVQASGNVKDSEFQVG